MRAVSKRFVLVALFMMLIPAGAFPTPSAFARDKQAGEPTATGAEASATMRSHTVLLASGGAVPDPRPLASAQSLTDARERLTLERDRVRAGRQRWEHLVAVQQDLVRNPTRFSQAATDAANDLNASGRLLVVEGLTAGLSNLFTTQGSAVKGRGGLSAAEKEELELRYQAAAIAISATHSLVVKDMLKPPDPSKWTPSRATATAVTGLNTALKLGVLVTVRDKNLRDGLNASLTLGKGFTDFLSAYLVDDQVSMARLLPLMQASLSGGLAITKAMARQPSPAELRGAAALIAKQVPAFGPVALMLAESGVSNFNISLLLANIGWGSYALVQGMSLHAEAEEIQRDQQQAAVRLQRLLPKARAEIARTGDEERRLTAAIEALGPAPPPMPRAMLPSARFIDAGRLQPASRDRLPDLRAAVRISPALTISLTIRELDRREAVFTGRTAQEREAERRRVEAARQGARAEARRLKEEQRRRAEEQERENRSRRSRSDSSSNSGGNSSGSTSDRSSSTSSSSSRSSSGGDHSRGWEALERATRSVFDGRRPQ